RSSPTSRLASCRPPSTRSSSSARASSARRRARSPPRSTSIRARPARRRRAATSSSCKAPSSRRVARALAADPDDSFALYLSAILAFKSDDAASTQAGITRLKHAIEVDPDLGQAWRALGKAYERAHDEPARADLAKRYEEKFKQPL